MLELRSEIFGKEMSELSKIWLYSIQHMISFGEVSYPDFSNVLTSLRVPNSRLFGKVEHAYIFWCIGERMKFIL